MITCEIEGLEELQQEHEARVIQLGRDVSKAVRSSLDTGRREAINTRGYEDQTGLLTSRIKGIVDTVTVNGAAGTLGAFTHYASYVNDGTKPHEIHGNPMLTFRTRSGAWVSVPMVNHPGSRADEFMDRGIDAAKQHLEETIGDLVSRLGS